MRTSLLHTLKRSWRALAMAALVPLVALTGCKEQQSKKTEPQPPRILTEADIPPQPKDAKYFRFKVEFKYRGEPMTYDIHGACKAVGLSEVLPTQLLYTGTTPYIYGHKMKDGQGVLLQVPKDICGITDMLRPSEGNPSYNKWRGVWRMWFPIFAVYPDADRPAEGWAYATEDAYKSPLSDLTFVSSLIEPSTLEKFLEWRRTEGPKNFVKEHMVEVHGGPIGMANRRAMRPGSFRLGAMCTQKIKVSIPDALKERVRAHWPPEKPRFWVLPASRPDLPEEQSQEVRWKIRNNIIFSMISDHLIRDLNSSPLRTGGGGGPSVYDAGRAKSHAVDSFPVKYFNSFHHIEVFEKAELLKVDWMRNSLADGGQYWQATIQWLAPPHLSVILYSSKIALALRIAQKGWNWTHGGPTEILVELRSHRYPSMASCLSFPDIRIGQADFTMLQTFSQIAASFLSTTCMRISRGLFSSSVCSPEA
jgi:hypothetical protein